MSPEHAVVDLPFLWLQVVLRDHPGWRNAPVAAVTSPLADAPLVYVGERARKLGIRPGMRPSAARNIVPTLHVGTVTDERTQEFIDDLARGLSMFSPRVMPDDLFRGAFFLDPRGLSGLYGGHRAWATSVQRFLKGKNLWSSVVVGFSRYRAFAIARQGKGPIVLESPDEERALSEETSLERLELPADLRQGLALLGIATLGEFLSIPEGELALRFGAEARTIHARFSDSPQLPLTPRTFEEAPRITLLVDPPDADHGRLLFAIKGGLAELCRTSASRAQAIAALTVTLDLDRGDDHVERIEPAAPTLDGAILIELVRLRLANVSLEAPVEGVALEAETTRAEPHQLRLAEKSTRRDAHAASRALARLRAAFGAHAVTRARLRDAHLPEARFEWEAITEIAPPRRPLLAEDEPRTTAPPLVRRLLVPPRPLPAERTNEPEAGPSLDAQEGKLLHLYGPYRVSGGWWVRTVERDYYYGETQAGSMLWLFYDRPRRRWYLHGWVD